MERPKAQDAGTIILIGIEPLRVLDGIQYVIKEFELQPQYTKISTDYLISNRQKGSCVCCWVTRP